MRACVKMYVVNVYVAKSLIVAISVLFTVNKFHQKAYLILENDN